MISARPMSFVIALAENAPAYFQRKFIIYKAIAQWTFNEFGGEAI